MTRPVRVHFEGVRFGRPICTSTAELERWVCLPKGDGR